MASQKGSLKDRIRFWKFTRTKRKQEKERQEQEEWNKFLNEKKSQGIYINPVTKKHGFFAILFHSLFGFFFGMFEISRKQDTKEKQLLQDVISLEKKVENNEEKEILKVYQDVERKKIEFVQLKKDPQKKDTISRETIEVCMKRLDVLKEKLEQKKQVIDFSSLKTDIHVTTIEEIENDKSNSSILETHRFDQISNQTDKFNPNEILLKNSISSKESMEILKPKEDNNSVLNEEIPIIVEQNYHNEKSVPMAIHVNDEQDRMKVGDKYTLSSSEDKYQKYLLTVHQRLEKQTEQLNMLKEEISQIQTEEDYKKIRNSLLWVQSQLFFMEQEYKEISKDRNFQCLKNQTDYYLLDSKALLKDDRMIQSLLDECKKVLTTVDIQKETKIVDSKKKEEKNEEFYLDIDDFEQLKNQIQMDISRQINEIKDIQITPVIQHSNGFFGKVFRLISNTLFLFTPMVFFKNKLTGILTSSIIVHNRVRSMRKLVDQKESLYETGETLFQQIHSKQECLSLIRMHFNESLIELNALKQSFIVKYQNIFPTETEMFLNQIEGLENQITEKMISLQINQNRLLSVQQKYQKILKK